MFVARSEDCRDSSPAATSNCSAAVPASRAAWLTPPIAEDTCRVPLAASCTLRPISLVATFCSSTAEATEAEIPPICSILSLIRAIACTVDPVWSWIALIRSAICSVARPVWVASDFTSDATTAKPLPASPARAASMVALSARRLV